MASDDYEEDHEISTLLNEPNEPQENSFELNDDFTFNQSEMIQSDVKIALLTPEEEAWVDSCFAVGPELSDDKWVSLKDAFLDALNMYPTPSGAKEDVFLDALNTYPTPSGAIENDDDDDDWVLVEASNVTELDNAMDHDSPEEMQKEPAIMASQEDMSSCDSIIRVRDGHATEHHLSGKTEISAEHVSLAGVATDPRADIFKVWALQTSVEEEEDELIAKINKLSQSRSRSQLPMNHSSLTSEQNCDELVGGLTDMSLKPLEK